jgi:hypothetical protein
LYGITLILYQITSHAGGCAILKGIQKGMRLPADKMMPTLADAAAAAASVLTFFVLRLLCACQLTICMINPAAAVAIFVTRRWLRHPQGHPEGHTAAS